MVPRSTKSLEILIGLLLLFSTITLVKHYLRTVEGVPKCEENFLFLGLWKLPEDQPFLKQKLMEILHDYRV